MDTLEKIAMVFYGGVLAVAIPAALWSLIGAIREMREAHRRRQIIAALQGWVPQDRRKG